MKSNQKDNKLTSKYRGFTLSGRISEPSVSITDLSGRWIGEGTSFKDAKDIVDSYISGYVEY